MQVYKYDERNPNALSIMDGAIGQYTNHLDDEFIFKTSNTETITFSWEGYTKGFHIKIKKGKVTSNVFFTHVGKNNVKIPGGIAIKTPTGYFRPQATTIANTLKAKKVSTIRSLSIRQLSELAKEAVSEYDELLRMMHES